ncbi:hypothetical protein [Mycolicibacterium sp.]|uniref:hypothetical protein n=1 Tax=Mycolicibacterium sp. TaxID=2320850 RepID=UPI001A338B55|nr:hypothetical protein [Mycolicibacterium sp.]MBJ7337882.1 hypothetical protein [Mycolicibacterium sp.]
MASISVGREKITLPDFAARRRAVTAIVSVVAWLIRGNAPNDGEPGAVHAESVRQELSGLRAQAQTDMARKYIELQQVRNSGLTSRAAYVERVIRALELELTTLERLGEGIYRSL